MVWLFCEAVDFRFANEQFFEFCKLVYVEMSFKELTF